eukprot:35064-Eustigmatos_ZCMA.PRE.1
MADHRLHCEWKLCFVPPSVASDYTMPWSEKLKNVHGFDTAEEFWCLWNTVAPPSNLKQGAEMYLFKGGAAPSYEDNPDGGVWSVGFGRQAHNE